MKLCLIKARAIYEPGGYGGADGLLVREGRIARLGGYDALKRAYPEAETIDWSALYVLPALVNTHVHLEFDATAQARVHYIDETPALRALGAAKRANEALKSGVATLRDAGSDWTLLDLKTPRAANSAPCRACDGGAAADRDGRPPALSGRRDGRRDGSWSPDASRQKAAEPTR